MTLPYVYLFFVRDLHDRVDCVPGVVQEEDGGVEGGGRGAGGYPGVVGVHLHGVRGC